MKAYETWTVLPHDPVQKPTENLWFVGAKMADGKTTRLMTIARMRDGGLVVHNAIALEDALMADLEAFGRPAVLVVPGGYHRMDARVWKDRYPAMRVLCPRGASKAVAKVVPVDGGYDEAPADEDVRLAYVDGTKDREGVLEVRSKSGTTLVFNDLVGSQPHLSGLWGFLLAPTGRPSVPRISRWMIVSDRRAVRAHLERLAAIPGLARILVSHSGEITDRPAEKLRAAAAGL